MQNRIEKLPENGPENKFDNNLRKGKFTAADGNKFASSLRDQTINYQGESYKICHNYSPQANLIQFFTELELTKDYTVTKKLSNPVYYQIGNEYFVESFNKITDAIKFIDEKREQDIESYVLEGIELKDTENEVIKLTQLLQQARKEINDLKNIISDQKNKMTILSETNNQLKEKVSELEYPQKLEEAIRNRSISSKIF